MLKLKTDASQHETYSFNEERLNALTHGLGCLLAIAGLVALIMKSDSLGEYFISTMYGASLAFMFLSSTVYHASKDIARRAFLRKIDHTAIYLLIAGTYTPFMLLAVGGTLGLISTILIWLIGVGGIVFKLSLGHKYPKIGVATYAIMGWFALFLIYPIYQSLSAGGFTLLLAGGIGYSLGIPFYMLKSRHYSHAIWHGFVIVGAACHYFAIYYHVL